MKILISGGTGFIGKTLIEALLNKGHEVTVISRQKQDKTTLPVTRYPQLGWLEWSEKTVLNTKLTAHDAVINLAGEGIADKRWSVNRKQQLRDSRIGFTAALISLIEKQSWKPGVWLNASAIGFYGCGSNRMDEDSDHGDDFSAELCRDWELTTGTVDEWFCRKVIMRFGVVLGQGGMLAKLKPSFAFGMGAQLGSGEQYLSWIHMDDLIKAIVWLLEDNTCSGVYNLTAPEAVTNKEFTQSFARALNRPAWMVMPGAVMKLMLGEMAEVLLLSGQKVYPKRLEEAGFTFDSPDISTALKNVFR